MIIKLSEAFVKNQYIDNVDNTVFTMMINEMDPNKFFNYKKRYYIHGLIKYSKWVSNIDLFEYLLTQKQKHAPLTDDPYISP